MHANFLVFLRHEQPQNQRHQQQHLRATATRWRNETKTTRAGGTSSLQYREGGARVLRSAYHRRHVKPHPPHGPLEAAIIDLDGTLVDTLGDFAQALGGMLDDLQLPGIALAHIAQLVGKGSEHLIQSVLQHA